ncbi:MAG: hypothetical protein L3J86_00870 [Thermoplasmata archaeon]|nr:hypothetical protein [Thermoplasmata archaeon]
MVIVAVVAVLVTSIVLAAPGPTSCAPCGPGVCSTSCSGAPEPWLTPVLLGVSLCFVTGMALSAAGFVYRRRHPVPIPHGLGRRA